MNEPTHPETPEMHHNEDEERNAAYRESGRAVAVALLGFTLQAVSVLPTRDDSDAIATQGFTAFRERPSATLDELTFIAAAGVWAELQAETFPDKGTLDMDSIFSRLSVKRERIDTGKLRFGLDYLVKNYRNAVLEIARQLMQRKIINGIECGQIILAHQPGQKKPN